MSASERDASRVSAGRNPDDQRPALSLWARCFGNRQRFPMCGRKPEPRIRLLFEGRRLVIRAAAFVLPRTLWARGGRHRSHARLHPGCGEQSRPPPLEQPRDLVVPLHRPPTRLHQAPDPSFHRHTGPTGGAARPGCAALGLVCLWPRGIRSCAAMNLEKAVETADDADDADGKGLEVKRPRTFEGTPKPSMDWVVQSVHLRNRGHLRSSAVK